VRRLIEVELDVDGVFGLFLDVDPHGHHLAAAD
jgi:hypothetical protein